MIIIRLIRIIRCWGTVGSDRVAACCRAVPKKYSKLIERTKRLLQLVPQPGTSRRAKRDVAQEDPFQYLS